MKTNDCSIDCRHEHLCIGVGCKKDNKHDCKEVVS